MPHAPNVITVTHARENLSFLVSRIAFCQDNYIIQRSGKKLAVLLSYEEYRLIREFLAHSIPTEKIAELSPQPAAPNNREERIPPEEAAKL